MIIVIPARGGSKRLPNKNIRKLCGKPLIAYTIEAVLKAGVDAPVIVSTDDEKIAKISLDYGVQIVDRPQELAAGDSSTESVLFDVLSRCCGDIHDCKWIMTLPPTSPFRSSKNIRIFFDTAIKGRGDVDCYMSVSENRGDFWEKGEGGKLQRLFKDAPRRQQDRTPIYEENSAIYVTRIDALEDTGSILGNNVRSMCIDPFESVDINTAFDFWLAESLLSNAVNRPK